MVSAAENAIAFSHIGMISLAATSANIRSYTTPASPKRHHDCGIDSSVGSARNTVKMILKSVPCAA